MSTTSINTTITGKAADPFSSLDALLNKARSTAANKRTQAAPQAPATENAATADVGVADREAKASYLATMSMLGSGTLGEASMGSHALDPDRVAKLLEL
ncbi:MAG: hypothetical protein AB7E47_10155 [Desulfovibrionaceae bacterium]